MSDEPRFNGWQIFGLVVAGVIVGGCTVGFFAALTQGSTSDHMTCTIKKSRILDYMGM